MLEKYREKIRNRLIFENNVLFLKQKVDEQEFRQSINTILEDIIAHDKATLSDPDKKKIVDELVTEFLGWGVIDKFMKDQRITEIMINGPKRIYIEKEGKTLVTDTVFENEQQLRHLIHKILEPTRRRVDESYPYVDVSMPDGSRVNIILYPIALEGPIVTIRKFLKDIKKIEDLIELGTMDRRIADLLLASIKAKVNIIFAGATGAGKTTTLNVLSFYISNEERIVTIEDTAELRLNQEHVVRLETRQPNIEGRGEITIRELFKNSLRMRPDRIILGEIRGPEALEMVQAICSGHSGSLSVIHADSPEDVMFRLETMILASGIPIGLEAIHIQMAAAMNLIIQQEQLVDGSRKITRVSQVSGIKDNQVTVEDLFYYVIEGFNPENGKVIGKWKATGKRPVFMQKYHKADVKLSDEIFNKD